LRRPARVSKRLQNTFKMKGILNAFKHSLDSLQWALQRTFLGALHGPLGRMLKTLINAFKKLPLTGPFEDSLLALVSVLQ